MSWLLTLVSRPEDRTVRATAVNAGVTSLRGMSSREPAAMRESDWASVATVGRVNGAGGTITSDPETGSWLAALGTWFHGDGFQSGEEARLLRAYLERGAEGAAGDLEGFFALVIGDERAREILVITDLVGSCHVYARPLGPCAAISNSSAVLAALGPVTLDPIGCQEFLRTGTMYEDRTFFREVRKLGPASIHRFPAQGTPSRSRYWSMAGLAPDRHRAREAVPRLHQALVGGAARIARAFDRPVCDLTGGYDSRAVVEAFLRAGVSFETVVSGPDSSRDVQISRELARVAGLKHEQNASAEPVTPEELRRSFAVTDGEYDLVEYARILRNHERLMRRHDVTVNGSFGEVARGYWWEVLWPHVGERRPLDARKVAASRYAASPTASLAFPPEASLDLIAHFAGIIARTNAGLESFPNTFQMDHAYLTMRMQRWQGRIASSTDRLWPCLSPFMLRSVLETSLETRARDRRGSALARRLLVDLDPKLASVPLEHGYPPLPVSWRTIHRFWPAPLYYGSRVLAKLSPSRAAQRPSPSLGTHPEIREIMRPGTMRLAALVGRDALARFLEGHDGDREWARVFTLETTLREVERLRSDANVLV